MCKSESVKYPYLPYCPFYFHHIVSGQKPSIHAVKVGNTSTKRDKHIITKYRTLHGPQEFSS